MKNKYSTGFTLVEVAVTVLIAALLCLGIAGLVVNNAGATEKRATEAAQAWIKTTGVEVQRMSCAHDSDGDGYGSCTIVTPTGEKIFLQCVADFFRMGMGASSCKEVESNIQITQRVRRH